MTPPAPPPGGAPLWLVAPVAFRSAFPDPRLVGGILDGFRATTGIGVRPSLLDLLSYEPLAEAFLQVEPADVVYLGEESIRRWRALGLIRPLPNPPDRMGRSMYASARSVVTDRGDLMGVPAYAGFQAFVVNTSRLTIVGAPAPGSLAGLVELCLELQARTPDTFPLALSLGPDDPYLFDYWTLMAAFGGRHFGQDERSASTGAAIRALEWIVDAIHRWRIVDPASIRRGGPSTLSRLAEGSASMGLIAQYELRALATTANAGGPPVRPALMPGPAGGPAPTVAWTRLYARGARRGADAAATALLDHLSAADAARRHFLAMDVGFAEPELWQDEAIRRHAATWTDPATLEQQQFLGVGRERVAEAWWSEWFAGHRELLGHVFAGRLRPAEALARSRVIADRLTAAPDPGPAGK